MADDDLVYLAITRLLGRYADIATRKAWPEFPPLAAPDARFTFDTARGIVEVVGPDAFAEFGAQSLEGFTFYEYIPLNVVVKTDSADTARGRVYSFEVGEERETGAWVTYYGLYHDDYVHHDGAWRFASRHYQALARRTNDHLDSFPMRDRAL
jgi:SnoaL-like protein